MEFMVSLLLLTNAVTVWHLWKLQGAVDTNAKNLENYSKWFKDEWCKLLQGDMDKVYLEQRRFLCMIWEYFYVILATRGVLKVNKETFITDGLKDMIGKYPNVEGIMRIATSEKESDLFDHWENHYVDFCKQSERNQEVEAIFQRHAHPPSES